MRLTLLLPLTLLGCSPPASEAPPAPSSAATQSAAPFDLRGQWGVSRLEGQTLDYRIAFTGSPAALTWEPGCAGRSILYRSEGDALVFYQEPTDGPQIVCDIGYPDDLPRVIDALKGRWQVERQEGGDLVLTRGGETITLEKLPVDTVETLAGEWRVAGIDGKGLDDAQGLALSADDGEIWWEPRCFGAIVPYRIVNERFIWNAPPDPAPMPPGATPPPPPPVCTIKPPDSLPGAMTALRAADRIERTRNNGVLLSGGGHSITLFSQ